MAFCVALPCVPAGRGYGRCLGAETSRSKGYTESIRSGTTVPHTRPAAAVLIPLLSTGFLRTPYPVGRCTREQKVPGVENAGGRIRGSKPARALGPDLNLPSSSDPLPAPYRGPYGPAQTLQNCRRGSAPGPIDLPDVRKPAGVFPGGRHISGHGPESGRAARAVRGRRGRYHAALWRLRDALPGSTGNGFVSGALSPPHHFRAVCFGRISSGRWRNHG